MAARQLCCVCPHGQSGRDGQFAHIHHGVSLAVSQHCRAPSAAAGRPFHLSLHVVAVLWRRKKVCHRHLGLSCPFKGVLEGGERFLLLSYEPEETTTRRLKHKCLIQAMGKYLDPQHLVYGDKFGVHSVYILKKYGSVCICWLSVYVCTCTTIPHQMSMYYILYR